MREGTLFCGFIILSLGASLAGTHGNENQVQCGDEERCLRKCCVPEVALSFDIHNNSAIPLCTFSLNSSSNDIFLNSDLSDEARYGFPECPSNYLQDVGLEMFQKSHCVNYLNDSAIIGLICEDQGPVEMKATLRKCCADGYKYDMQLHTCLPSSGFDITLFNFLSVNFSGFSNISYGMPPCTEVLVDFTLGDESKVSSEELQSDMICVDQMIQSDKLIGRRCENRRKTCEKLTCVRKCCPPGKHMNSKKCSLTDSERGLNLTFYDTSNPTDLKLTVKEVEHGFLHSSVCATDKKYLLKPNNDSGASFYLSSNGSLYVPRYKLHYSRDDYCLEDFLIPGRGMDGMFALLCVLQQNVVDPKPTLKYILLSVGLIFSCVFLLATLVVYSVLPSLQNLHGKTLMCTVASSLLAFTCIASLQIGTNTLDKRSCQVVGFVNIFAILASFFWMNVMCFDIWWTFGGVRSMSNSSNTSRERRRFALYSLYAWGLPIAITATAITFDLVDNRAPDIFKPKMGVDTCWFKKKDPSKTLYFITPASILITCNIVLFVLTARNCSKVKAEINRMQKATDEGSKKKFQADMNTLLMNCKLFVVMGCFWIFEMFAVFFPDGRYAWLYYVADAFTALQGVLIFAIFVLKGKVLKALAARCGIRRYEAPGINSGNRLSCGEASSRKISASSMGRTTTEQITAISQQSFK